MSGWSFACDDWEQRLRAGRSLVPDLPLDRQEAARAVGIFNRLKLSDVPQTPALEEAAGDWFRDIARALLGSIDPETGMRMVREVFCLVPKKNSKTSYGALLVLTALLMNERPRAEYLFIGPTQAVSELAFAQVMGAIELDDFLRKRMHVQEHLKAITDRKTKAQLKIKSFDASVLTGVKPAGVLIDELHEIAKNAKASRIIGQIRGGLLPNPEGFLVFITTQSDDVPVGAFKSELQKARAIRDGKQTGAMLPVLYEFPLAIAKDQEKWSQPKYWPMVTPNAGRSITIERLIPDFETARDTGPDELRRWASQHLNIEIGLGLHTDRWAGADHWEEAEQEFSLEELIRRCEVIVVGIDGGGLDDLLGLTVIGREPGVADLSKRRRLSWSRAWAHRSVLERRKDIAAKLEDLDKAGELVLVDVPGADVTEVADLVLQIEASGKLAEKHAIGVDPAGIAQIVDELVDRRIAQERIVGISQGWKLSGAIKTAERGLADGSFVHAAQALMNWCVANAKTVPAGNALTITKAAAGSAKIDPLIALFCAQSLMSLNPPARRSIYEERGLLVI